MKSGHFKTRIRSQQLSLQNSVEFRADAYTSTFPFADTTATAAAAHLRTRVVFSRASSWWFYIKPNVISQQLASDGRNTFTKTQFFAFPFTSYYTSAWPCHSLLALFIRIRGIFSPSTTLAEDAFAAVVQCDFPPPG